MALHGSTEIAQTFVIGMADYAVVRNQNLVLTTHPLGACLGVAIYDSITNVGGMLHGLLPESSIDPERAASRPAMFLDTGLAAMLNKAIELGAAKNNLRVYVAGGGRIMDDSAFFNIGKRNYDVLLERLTANGLKIAAEAWAVSRTAQSG